MTRYILIRLLLAIPTMLVVTFVAFFLSLATPGDIIQDHIAASSDEGYAFLSPAQKAGVYRAYANQLNKDKPPFYLSIVPHSFPDTLHRILYREERNACRALLYTYGNWELIQRYRASIAAVNHTAQLPDTSLTGQARSSLIRSMELLAITSDPQRIRQTVKVLREDPVLAEKETLANLQEAVNGFVNTPKRSGLHFPKLIWHGNRNQYHLWISRFLRGDFGRSIIDGRPVGKKIWTSLRWTLWINLTAIILAFGISIPLGVSVAKRADSLYDTIISGILFVFFAIPSFWLATTFVVFLTTPEYGAWTDIFPSAGLGDYALARNPWQRAGIIASHLFLPVICLTLGALAYLTRQLRQGILKEMNAPYVLVARARGVGEKQLLWKHALRNALFPIITILASVFPALISGSIIIEVIFNIPGMGTLMYDSIRAQDWQVVFAILVLSSFLTIGGILVSDILYRKLDPRVSFTNTTR